MFTGNKKIVFIIMMAAMCLLSACGSGAAAEMIDPNDIGDPENGRVIFENGTEIIKNDCAGCHTLDGIDFEHPNGRWIVPSLKGISEVAGDRVPEMSAIDYLRQSIIDPGAFIVEGYEDGMDKGYKYGLTEDEVNDLIAFLLTQ